MRFPATARGAARTGWLLADRRAADYNKRIVDRKFSTGLILR
jgi:hypothetical protein